MAKSELNDWGKPEYKRSDLGELVRGKYARRIREATNVVVLDPPVAKAFPNDKAVNNALRGLIKSSARKEGCVTVADNKKRCHELASEVLAHYEDRATLGSVDPKDSQRTNINLIAITPPGGWSPMPPFVVDDLDHETDDAIKTRLRAHIEWHISPEQILMNGKLMSE